MKMTDIFTTGFVLGCLLILIGTITLINIIFHIHIPIFRIVIAALLVYFGIKMLVGTSRTERYYYSSSCTTQGICTEKNVIQYNVLFNKQVIDLTTTNTLAKNMLIEINTSFGESIVLLDTTKPIRIEGSAAFGSMELLDKTVISFGNHTYQTPTYESGAEPIHIKAKVAFGKCIIMDKKNYHGPMNEGQS